MSRTSSRSCRWPTELKRSCGRATPVSRHCLPTGDHRPKNCPTTLVAPGAEANGDHLSATGNSEIVLPIVSPTTGFPTYRSLPRPASKDCDLAPEPDGPEASCTPGPGENCGYASNEVHCHLRQDRGACCDATKGVPQVDRSPQRSTIFSSSERAAPPLGSRPFAHAL